jgi:ADP-heptose:LPS heptosyltransferase
MSNILIIKHGSLGDIAQASGAIQDIFENHKEDQIHLLTTKPYFELFKKNPFIHNVILDKRLSRFNLIYLYQLTRILKNFNFEKVYDLQNSSRTTFYKNILFPKVKFDKWSSSETTLPTNIPKVEFDKNPVLDRFDHQLKTSGINIFCIINFRWSWSYYNFNLVSIPILN